MNTGHKGYKRTSSKLLQRIELVVAPFASEASASMTTDRQNPNLLACLFIRMYDLLVQIPLKLDQVLLGDQNLINAVIALGIRHSPIDQPNSPLQIAYATEAAASCVSVSSRSDALAGVMRKGRVPGDQ